MHYNLLSACFAAALNILALKSVFISQLGASRVQAHIISLSWKKSSFAYYGITPFFLFAINAKFFVKVSQNNQFTDIV